LDRAPSMSTSRSSANPHGFILPARRIRLDRGFVLPARRGWGVGTLSSGTGNFLAFPPWYSICQTWLKVRQVVRLIDWGACVASNNCSPPTRHRLIDWGCMCCLQQLQPSHQTWDTARCRTCRAAVCVFFRKAENARSSISFIQDETEEIQDETEDETCPRTSISPWCPFADELLEEHWSHFQGKQVEAQKLVRSKNGSENRRFKNGMSSADRPASANRISSIFECAQPHL